MISGPKKEEVLLLPKNIMALRHKQAGFPYNSPDTSKGICVQARGNHPPPSPHPLSKPVRVTTLLGNHQGYRHLVLESKTSLQLCRCQGGPTDEMCQGPAPKNAQVAGSEATPQLASCHLLICMHFTCRQEAAQSMKYIGYFLFGFSFLWCCVFVLAEQMLDH